MRLEAPTTQKQFGAGQHRQGLFVRCTAWYAARCANHAEFFARFECAELIAYLVKADDIRHAAWVACIWDADDEEIIGEAGAGPSWTASMATPGSPSACSMRGKAPAWQAV